MKEPSRILVADDDKDVLNLLVEGLTGWGYQVLVAHDGAKAWDILKEKPVWLVISDWTMPGIDGLELCRRIRAARFPYYIYTILLTARSRKEEMLQGMKAGADDFMVKPFGMDELKARIFAAERVLRLERDLEKRNKELSEINQSLSRAHEVITRDLASAAWVQQSLLPTAGSLYGFNFESLFIPCRVVGGDIFSYFPVGPHHVAFYSVDVSGHGIPAAMLSVSVSKTILSMPFHETRLSSNVIIAKMHDSISPSTVAKELNFLFQSTETVEQYFTMVYGVIDRRSGEVIFTQAGHPHPIYVPTHGEAIMLGSGGLPVGLLPDAKFAEESQMFEPGDRLFLYTDGISDCTNNSGERFSADRLKLFLSRNRDLPLNKLMRKIGEELYRFNGNNSFEDDLSLLVFERNSGP